MGRGLGRSTPALPRITFPCHPRGTGPRDAAHIPPQRGVRGGGGAVLKSPRLPPPPPPSAVSTPEFGMLGVCCFVPHFVGTARSVTRSMALSPRSVPSAPVPWGLQATTRRPEWQQNGGGLGGGGGRPALGGGVVYPPPPSQGRLSCPLQRLQSAPQPPPTVLQTPARRLQPPSNRQEPLLLLLWNPLSSPPPPPFERRPGGLRGRGGLRPNESEQSEGVA